MKTPTDASAPLAATQKTKAPSSVAKSRKKKTWREKLHSDHGLPKVIIMDAKMKQRFGEGTMVIPSPLDVDSQMKKVPQGRLTTIDAIKTQLAKQHHTNTACAITTGIFAWIAAHAAEEERQSQTSSTETITPYWRTVKAGGELNAKYPGGVEALQTLLEAEGHKVIQKGKKWLVQDFEMSVVTSG